MDQCKRHFKGDLTAHATADWFLSELFPDKQLSRKDNAKRFINRLRDENSPLSADLCNGLTTARFIDCLRNQVKKDTGLFERIEEIAKVLNKTRGGETYPNLCVLLLSMARNYLKLEKHFPDKEDVRETSLYKVVKHIYNDYKDRSNKNDIFLALEAGIQLSRFQEAPWQEFTEFKIQHYKEWGQLRQQYFSADNPTMLSRRVVERYKWNNPPLDPENLTEFEQYIEDYTNPNPDSDFPHPRCLRLPILARSIEAMRIASDLAESLREDPPYKQFSKTLANQFRILQWDIFGRDIVQEHRSTESKLSFYSITDKRNIEAMLNDDDLIEFINSVRSAECRFSPSEEEILTDLRDNSGQASDISENKIRAYLTSFREILPIVSKKQESAHEDFICSFANSGEKSILIEDGELSFFSLLWLLRRATHKRVNIDDWLLDESKKSEVRFCLSDNIDDRCSSYEFAEECGFIIRLSESDQCISTTRWQSLITWLRRLNRKLRKQEEYKKCSELCQETEKVTNDNYLLERVPVKALDYNEEETSFVKSLWRFLASEPLEKALNEINETSSDAPMTCANFVTEKLKPLVTSLKSDDVLLPESAEGQVESQGDLNNEFQDIVPDKVLLRCCRAVFLPVECLFRSCFPCELHLLIQALNWEESSVSNLGTVPASLGFATIVGRVETEEILTNFESWRVPYRSLFSTLAADLTLPAVKDASEQKGIELGTQEQQIYFAHQTAGLLDTIWIDPKRNDLDFRSKFALWLARIHVTDIWGGFPLDTDNKIYVDFPEWKDLNGKQTFEELVKLGLRGGLLRAQKPPKPKEGEESGTKNALRKLMYYCNDLETDNPELSSNHDKLISHVRNLLSFRLPTNDPPDWVTTQAFAICFYHGMRQAVFHGLETFVMIDDERVQKENPCLWIEWDKQSVLIYNRGKVKEKHYQDKPNDRGFFERFVRLAKVFRIDGPEPTAKISDTWQLVIRKEK